MLEENWIHFHSTMKINWIALLLNLLLIVQANAAHISGSNETSTKAPQVTGNGKQYGVCSDDDITWWNIDFHNCFFEKKYGDGGKNLNSIVDRILDHAEACTEIANKNCQPNDSGFFLIINKIIEQMKDYAELYLELILKDRGNIKDLECMESALMPRSYRRCFVHLFNHSDPDAIKNSTEYGIACVNVENARCSSEAKTSLNRIVRRILGAKEPPMEDFQADQPTKPPHKELFSTIEPRKRSRSFRKEDFPSDESLSRSRYFTKEHSSDREPAKPAEEKWHWYDYIAYPFVEAWKAIRSLFG